MTTEQQPRIKDDDFLEWKSQMVTREFFGFLASKILDYKTSIIDTVLNSELIKPEQLQELNNELVYFHALEELFTLTPNDINNYYADKESKTA